jgi:hypothetical protein
LLTAFRLTRPLSLHGSELSCDNPADQQKTQGDPLFAVGNGEGVAWLQEEEVERDERGYRGDDRRP